MIGRYLLLLIIPQVHIHLELSLFFQDAIAGDFAAALHISLVKIAFIQAFSADIKHR